MLRPYRETRVGVVGVGMFSSFGATSVDAVGATAGDTVFLGLSTLFFHLSGVAMVCCVMCVGSFCRRG